MTKPSTRVELCARQGRKWWICNCCCWRQNNSYIFIHSCSINSWLQFRFHRLENWYKAMPKKEICLFLVSNWSTGALIPVIQRCKWLLISFQIFRTKSHLRRCTTSIVWGLQWINYWPRTSKILSSTLLQQWMKSRLYFVACRTMRRWELQLGCARYNTTNDNETICCRLYYY